MLFVKIVRQRSPGCSIAFRRVFTIAFRSHPGTWLAAEETIGQYDFNSLSSSLEASVPVT